MAWWGLPPAGGQATEGQMWTDTGTFQPRRTANIGIYLEETKVSSLHDQLLRAPAPIG
jgi:hypothetical protein